MSDTLAEDAPDLTEAAPDGAPSEEPAADAVSGGDGKVIPVERFNGLMSKFNKTQTELAAERQAREELANRLKEFETGQTHTAQQEPGMSTEHLEEQVNYLTQLLVQERMDNVRAKVLEKHPELEPFQDMIVADTPDQYQQFAEQFAERLTSVSSQGSTVLEGTPNTPPAPEPQAPAAEPPAPEVEPPVSGGGSGHVPSEPNSEARISEAIQNRDWGSYLRAKVEAATSTVSL